MEITSMAFRTDMIFWRRDGRVIDCGAYIVVATPSNPTYYGGNLLLFSQAPVKGDAARWSAFFEREFKHQPQVRHRLFMWDVRDDHDGETQEFVEAGFEVPEMRVTLLADAVHPPRQINREIKVKPVETNEEWRAASEIQVACRDPRIEIQQFIDFREKRQLAYRKLIEAGLGKWYGAFLDGKLVADLGIFRDGPVARFQAVETAPEFRRRGICGTLVYEVSKMALDEWGASTLVMVADENYHAARLYESVGFKPKERYSFVCRFPPKDERA